MIHDLVWYELKEYEVEGISRKLFCRLSTNRDVKKREIHGHNSEYYRWVLSQQKLGNYIRQRAGHEMKKTKKIAHMEQKVKNYTKK